MAKKRKSNKEQEQEEDNDGRKGKKRKQAETLIDGRYDKKTGVDVSKLGEDGVYVREAGQKKSDCDGKWVKIISWNVNGLRALLKNQKEKLTDMVQSESPDLLFLQETKLQEKDVSEQIKDTLENYESHWASSISKKGYAGTCLFVKKSFADKVKNIQYGIDQDKHNEEGRSITVEVDDMFIVGLYVPNSGQKLERLEYRTKDWDLSLRKYVKSLEEKGKPVVICGDLNVAHKDIDVYNPKAKHLPKVPGCTAEERESFTEFLQLGYVDTFREMNPEAHGCFTYWSVRANNRPKNKGLRLDYFIVSERLFPRVHDSYLLDSVSEPASDHCPIGCVIKLD